MGLNVAKEDKAFSVVLVEDHELMRQGIRSILASDEDVELVGEAGTAQEAVALICGSRPDVVIMDIQLRQGTGIDVSRAISTLAPDSKILVLSGHDDQRYVKSLTKLGVNGYLLKSASSHELLTALHQVASGCLIFDPGVSDTVKSLLEGEGDTADKGTEIRRLTARETEVLEHLRDGRMNHEIGAAMGISIKTVETHVANLLRKLDAQNRTQAVSKSGIARSRERSAAASRTTQAIDMA
jgi:DNA-binding NarL/FixJ family response regulator